MAIIPGSDASGKTPEGLTQGLQFPPGLGGYNRQPGLGIRRAMMLDNGNRIASQIEHDRGVYVRPPVPPVEYAEGNIKKSTELTGVAGYNQRAIPLKDSADDMSQMEYLSALRQADPAQRLRMQQGLLMSQQNFLNTPTVQAEYPSMSSNMVDNLMMLAKAKLSAKKS